MAMSKKATPNLPSSSRMQMPAGASGKTAGKIKQSVSTKSTTKKAVAKVKKSAMPKKGYK
jgi:hypothetical protein